MASRSGVGSLAKQGCSVVLTVASPVYRLGYNYGRSPVPSSAVFQNLLIPAIGEHHFTTGFSIFLTKKIGIHAAYIRDFVNTATDDGSINPLGAGATYSVGGNAFSTQINVDF